MWQIKKLGKIDYQKAYEYQLSLVDEKLKGNKDNFFLLCEHNLVFTRGKGSKEKNILDKNIPLVMTNRGGDLTCHEPGQMIGYVILDLKQEKLSVKNYLDKLELVIINTLKSIEIDAEKNPELVGVWVKDKKIASIGIGIKNGITMHGFALNVNNELKQFSRINPCGLNPDIMTSVKKLSGKDYSMDRLYDVISDKFIEVFL